MGLFSSKTTINVSSSVYNMSGDEEDRPNFIKSAVFSAIMNPNEIFIGESVVTQLTRGPGMLQRGFFKYAKDKDLAGLPTYSSSQFAQVDPSSVASQITVIEAGDTTQVITAQVTDGDYAFWAEQYIRENNPTEVDTDWVADYDADNHEITVQFIGGTTTTFGAGNFSKDYKYVVANYFQTPTSSLGTLTYIYQVNTGNSTLDALITETTTTGALEFYPFLPIRINNVSITDSQYSDLYNETNGAYSVALPGQSFVSLVNEIEDNDNIGDIDYAYLQWGVTVNTTDNTSRDYLYEFYRGLVSYQNSSYDFLSFVSGDVASYNAAVIAYNQWETNYEQWETDHASWVAAQDDPEDPLYETTEPVEPTEPNAPSIGSPESTTIRLQADHTALVGYDNRYSWVHIKEEVLTGLGKVDAKIGEVWYEEGSTVSQYGYNIFQVLIPQLGSDISQVFMYRQVSATVHTRLDIWGMVHRNFIYGGKSVNTYLIDTLTDVEDSPFIIPMHYPTMKAVGLKTTTQMSMSNAWLTFNSYTVVKQKWYKRFLGMLTLIITIVVAVVLFNPALAAGAVGIFGANAAVGATLGFTGISATLAGAAANAIAAVVLSKVITSVSIKVFGEKWGALIGAIVSVVVTMGISAGGIGNLDMASMLKPEALLKMSDALANGYSGFVASEINDIQAMMETGKSVYDNAVKSIQDLMAENGMLNDLMFDPMSLTDSVRGNVSNSSYVPESLDEFIGRTTMVGSDIVEITLSMVHDYAELQRTLPKT